MPIGTKNLLMSYVILNMRHEEVFIMFDNLFGRFGREVNVNQAELFNIADQASEMDLKNEEQVRALIQSVGAIVGRQVDKAVEDKLTKMIINGEVPTDMNELLRMMM